MTSTPPEAGNTPCPTNASFGRFSQMESGPAATVTSDRPPIEDTGLSILYSPPDGVPIVDIIFVHGIQGHPVRTWSANGPEETTTGGLRKVRNWVKDGLSSKDHHATKKQPSAVFWPQDLLPEEVPQARIMTWGYDSMVVKPFSPTNKVTLFGHAKNLMFTLGRNAVPGRPIIFMAHSLGGILAKEMLANCDMSDNTRHKKIVDDTAGIMFFGTPHRGSKDLASVGEVARKAAGILLDTNSAALDSLGLKTTDLERSQEHFSRIWRRQDFRVKTWQEGTGISSMNLKYFKDKVVPDISSQLGDAREEAETLQGNHMDIVRMLSKTDPNYVAVLSEMRLMYTAIQDERQRAATLASTTDNNETANASSSGLDLKDQRACIQSLAFPDMKLREHSILQPRDGTCIWLSNHRSFKAWMSGTTPEEQVLFLRGKIGSGKSTTVKATMQDFGSRPGYLTAGYFFDSSATTTECRSAEGLYRSILYQLVSRDNELQQSFLKVAFQPWLESRDLEYGQTESWNLSQLQMVFHDTLRKPHSPVVVMVFVDALDEGDSAQLRRVVQDMRELVASTLGQGITLKLCFSSRNPIIGELGISVDECNSDDICLYVTKSLSVCTAEGEGSSRWQGIVKKITDSARGIFLWAVLVSNLVLEYHDQGENTEFITQRLHQLPPELGVLYGDLLRNMSTAKGAVTTYHVFLWAILSTGRLRLREWHHILPFLQEDPPCSLEQLRHSEAYIESDEQLERKVRFLTRGLVDVSHRGDLIVCDTGDVDDDNNMAEVDSARGGAGSLDTQVGETRIVQPIHDSVRSFFLGGDGFKILRAECIRLSDDGTYRRSIHDWAAPKPMREALAQGHYSIMTHCLAYLDVLELDGLALARGSRPNSPSGGKADYDTKVKVASGKWASIKNYQEYRSRVKSDQKRRKSTHSYQEYYRSTTPPIPTAESSYYKRHGSPVYEQHEYRARGYYYDGHHEYGASRRRGSVASFSSAGSSAGSPTTSLYEIRVQRPPDNPRYYQTNTGIQTASPRPAPGRPHSPSVMSMRATVVQNYLAQKDEEETEEVPQSPPGSDPHSPSPWSPDRPVCLSVFPALLHYATTQLLVHAARAEELGAQPGAMALFVRDKWRRYWLLRDEGPVPDMRGYCVETGLHAWVTALDTIKDYEENHSSP
ncbi:hypothetical protein PG997_009218 [Apiospora hydei]|uniref:Nephrocystin 3-like N-terminal domain-containing protein n=1 Tax=Apiospora hydei TaxID=1337664 RepID=A0ABR1VWL5_9PEZI